MNFQTVEANNGNLVTMFGVFTEIGGLQYTPQQKAKAICKIRDDAGVEHNVHIYQGKGVLPGPAQFNQRCEFSLSTFQGSYQNRLYTGYSGFWRDKTQASQPPQPTPQDAQQGASQPAGQANGKKEVDWDAKEAREKRGYAFRDATLIKTTITPLAGEVADLTFESIVELAELIFDYIYHGKDLGTVESRAKDHDQYAQEADDIPF